MKNGFFGEALTFHHIILCYILNNANATALLKNAARFVHFF
jgi:hypothetical protein